MTIAFVNQLPLSLPGHLCRARLITFGLACLLLLSAPAEGQQIGGQWERAWVFDGPGVFADVFFGASSSWAGDVDGDGFDDVIVGAPGEGNYAGAAYVYSGRTGKVIWKFAGSGWAKLGLSVSGAGDLNHDGQADLIVGLPGSNSNLGSVHAYSGATGALLWQFNGVTGKGSALGVSVASAGDVNGDGMNDVIAGAPYHQGGYAFVLSGLDGTQIWEVNGSGELGHSASGAGDVDSDGFADFVVGDPEAVAPGGSLPVGSASVFSGRTGQLIWEVFGSHYYSALGEAVAGVGDANQDGVPDILIGIPYHDPGGLGGAGAVVLVSGSAGEFLQTIAGSEWAGWFGSSVSSAGDVDGDGRQDFVVGAPGSNPAGIHAAGSAFVYSGSSVRLLERIDGQFSYAGLGESVSYSGDVDGDGLADVIVGAPESFGLGSGAGKAYVYSLNPFLHPDSDRLSATSGTSVSIQVNFPVSEAGGNYILLASGGIGPMTLGGLEIPLSRWNKLTQLMLQGWAPSNVLNWRGVLDANGDATCTILSDPRLARHLGSTIAIAAVSFDLASKSGRLSSIARYLTVVP